MVDLTGEAMALGAQNSGTIGSNAAILNGLGVDIDTDKILSCVKRGVPAYQGDILALLATFPDDAFDRVIFSRTVEELEAPDLTLAEGLRVGKRVTVGFVNHGFWLNRLNYLFKGQRTLNEVYRLPWYQSLPANAFSVREFEQFCEERLITIENRVYLGANWEAEAKFLPNVFAGYAIYDLSRASSVDSAV
jgi:methionine biosynthesis protein MetW